MNFLAQVDAYAQQYKDQFGSIRDLESYKWTAIKTFQEAWDPDAGEFHQMLTQALSGTQNLLASGKYLPRAVLLEMTEVAPTEVRTAMLELFDESQGTAARLERFDYTMRRLKGERFPEKGNSYQDMRAGMVYLALRHPERHFLYKYKMHKEAAKRLALSTGPKRGDYENPARFAYACDMIRDRLLDDDELVKLHHSRLKDDCYADPAYTVLTQDFVYAVTRHLSLADKHEASIGLTTSVREGQDDEWDDPAAPVAMLAEALQAKATGGDAQPRHVDWDSRQDRNRRVGRIGEVLVYEREVAGLRRVGRDDLADKVRHVALEDGDGVGYDIRSYTSDGEPKYIEVKATEGPWRTPFYVTRREVEASRQKADAYYLYRVFDLKAASGSGSVKKYVGALEPLCGEPESWWVRPDG